MNLLRGLIWKNLRSPLAGMVMLFTGIVTAMILAPFNRNEYFIINGAELSLLAISRFLILGQTIWFFRGLMLLGLSVPLVGGFTSPLFYHGRLRLEYFMEVFGIGFLPGMGLAILGLIGIRKCLSENAITAPTGPAGRASSFMWLIDYGCEGSIWLMIFTLLSGTWSDVGVVSVILGAFVLVACLVVLVLNKTTIGRFGMGMSLLFAGAITIVSSIVIVATQGNRCKEAVLGIPPGGLLMLVGFMLAMAKPAPIKE